jgi:GT2 family glycosyltransferase
MGFYGGYECLSMKRVYALLVNWNGWGDTIECLESLIRVEGIKLSVIVCDNDSMDFSLDRIRSWAEGSLDVYVPAQCPLRRLTTPPLFKPLTWVQYERNEAETGGNHDVEPQLVLIRTGANLGFAGGNNVGLRYALARKDFDYIWILNNDTVVEPLALEAMVKKMLSEPSAGMCGSTLLHYNEPNRIQARGGGYYLKWIGLPWHMGRHKLVSTPFNIEFVERWMNYVEGASILVSCEFLEKIGLFSEMYFLYFEESDWAQRAKGKFALAYAPDSIVYHKIGASIGTSSNPRKKSILCDFYAIRNRLIFTRQYFPWALPTIYLSVFTALVVRILSGRWAHAAVIARLLMGNEEQPC